MMFLFIITLITHTLYYFFYNLFIPTLCKVLDIKVEMLSYGCYGALPKQFFPFKLGYLELVYIEHPIAINLHLTMIVRYHLITMFGDSS